MRERLRVQQWLNVVAAEQHKTFSPWLWHNVTADGTKEAARAKLAARFPEMERHFADRPFLTGGRFTVADAYAFTIVNWSNFLGIDLGPYPHLVALMRRVAERPRVREAL